MVCTQRWLEYRQFKLKGCFFGIYSRKVPFFCSVISISFSPLVDPNIFSLVGVTLYILDCVTFSIKSLRGMVSTLSLCASFQCLRPLVISLILVNMVQVPCPYTPCLFLVEMV